jgi:hypothetical protein
MRIRRLIDLPEIGTRQEFAKALSVCSRTLHRAEQQNGLTAIRPNGKTVLYRRIDVLKISEGEGCPMKPINFDPERLKADLTRSLELVSPRQFKPAWLDLTPDDRDRKLIKLLSGKARRKRSGWTSPY